MAISVSKDMVDDWLFSWSGNSALLSQPCPACRKRRGVSSSTRHPPHKESGTYWYMRRCSGCGYGMMVRYGGAFVVEARDPEVG